jgi:DNA primase
MASTAVQAVKDRLGIVEVVGSYVKLTKAGKNYKGLSPFKKEKTPSFYVSPDRGVYYCFSTGKGGDLFTFVQEMENVDFRGALQILAERAGVELVPESREAKDERDRLFRAVAQAVAYYQAQLTENPEALAYLEHRGVQHSISTQFALGYAPAKWDALATHLTHLGFQFHELEKAGLIKKGERGAWYDRFRSRIMFPINDASGRPVGFSGRIIGVAAQDSANAKYINSPEGPLYDKSMILFGYDRAKTLIRKYDCSILVEGQMDLVLSHQAGWGNTVAVSGTGLTLSHLDLLFRASKNIVLALDADAAGIASAHKSALMAIRKGMDVKIAVLPEGKDPADVILQDKEGWRQAIRNAVPAIEYFISWSKAVHPDPRKQGHAIRSHVLPLITAIDSSIDAAFFVRRVAESLGIPMEAVWADIRSVQSLDEPETPVDAPATLSPKERTLQMLWGIALVEAGSPDPTHELFAEITRAADEPFEALHQRLVHLHERLQFAADANGPYDATVIRDMLTELTRLVKVHKRQSLAEAIKVAESMGDQVKLDELMQALSDLSRAP